MERNISIQIQDAQQVLEVFAKLDEKNKELAIATLTGMCIVAEADKKTQEKVS